MQYIIESDSFELKDIFECGQCFRWNKEENGTYTGVFKNCVLNVEKEHEIIIFKGNSINGDSASFEKLIDEYFDINRNYKKIKQELQKIDDNLKLSVEYGKGIRILNQELWETIISFIISANNNIPRIKGIIERICKKYGREIEWDNKSYFTFPEPEQLAKASVEDLRNLGLGFRDVRVYETTKMINNNEFEIKDLYKMDTNQARERLLELPGVGPKVADCILLFSDLKRMDVFPIDVWVRRVMNELYIHNVNEAKVNKKEIEKIAYEKFGNLQGIAQQYLFYWKRSA